MDFVYSVNYTLRSMCYGLESIVKSGIYSVIPFCSCPMLQLIFIGSQLSVHDYLFTFKLRNYFIIEIICVLRL